MEIAGAASLCEMKVASNEFSHFGYFNNTRTSLSQPSREICASWIWLKAEPGSRAVGFSGLVVRLHRAVESEHAVEHRILGHFYIALFAQHDRQLFGGVEQFQRIDEILLEPG